MPSPVLLHYYRHMTPSGERTAASPPRTPAASLAADEYRMARTVDARRGAWFYRAWDGCAVIISG